KTTTQSEKNQGDSANEHGCDHMEPVEAEVADNAEKMQEARELVARLMVLALAAPEPESPEKLSARAPRRTGSAATTLPAPKGGLRAPAKSTSTRISSFGVASTNNPVRSVNASAEKEPLPPPADKEQILDICRKLQQLL
ncbi:hypothetical protein EV174_005743, partial [Coemansia sp. RSA 2320]